MTDAAMRRTLALIALLAAVLGFTGNLGELLSIDGILASDNFLHLASGAGALLIGLLGGDLSERRVRAVKP